MISRIRQKHKNGCAVACVAMVAVLSYDEALKLTHPFRKPRQHTTTDLDKLIHVLEKLHLGPIIQEKRKISSIKKTAILAINCGSSKRPWYHAVVWDPESKKIIDPDGKKPWPRQKYQRKLHCVIEIKKN